MPFRRRPTNPVGFQTRYDRTMRYVKRVTALVCAAVLAVKLFLLEVSYPEVTTDVLLLKFVPSFKSYVHSTHVPPNTLTLFVSENGYHGQKLYGFVVHYVWWIAVVVLVLLAADKFSIHKSGRD